MSLSENCRINEQYYQIRTSEGKVKWNRKAWKPEWRKLKKNGTSVMVSSGEKLIKGMSLKEEQPDAPQPK